MHRWRQDLHGKQRGERALCGVACGKKWSFAGADRGTDRATIMATLITTARLNDLDPKAWLADVLDRIADLPASRLRELLPGDGRRSRRRQYRAPRKQLPKKCHRPAQTFVRRHQRLRFVHRIAGQAFPVQTIRHRPVKTLPVVEESWQGGKRIILNSANCGPE